MKKYLLLFSAVVLAAACSSPKYTYHFDHYDYNSGRKNAVAVQKAEEISPLSVSPEALVASTEASVMVEEVAAPEVESKLQTMANNYKNLSKAEQKEFRKELRSEMKNYAKEMRTGEHGASVAATKAMDKDLKLAIIFGAVGLTLNLIGYANSVFWVLGVIAIVIGVVFFVKWIAKQ